MKKEGGKYSHLHEELHLLIEAYGHPADCYRKLSLALWRLHEFFIQVERVSWVGVYGGVGDFILTVLGLSGSV